MHALSRSLHESHNPFTSVIEILQVPTFPLRAQFIVGHSCECVLCPNSFSSDVQCAEDGVSQSPFLFCCTLIHLSIRSLFVFLLLFFSNLLLPHSYTQSSTPYLIANTRHCVPRHLSAAAARCHEHGSRPAADLLCGHQCQCWW